MVEQLKSDHKFSIKDLSVEYGNTLCFIKYIVSFPYSKILI